MKLWSLVFSILVFSINALAKVEVEMKNSVDVGTALNLQLEDLVVLKNQSADTIRSVLDMDLPFKDDTISKDDILAWLKSALQERPDLRNISFKIPQAIQVTNSKGLSLAQIKQRFENRLTIKCGECSFKIQISNVPEVTAKSVMLEWKDIPVSGAFMLPVTTKEGQNISWISGQIKAQRQVIKTSKVIRANDTILDSDLIFETADISFSKDYFVRKSDLIGKKVARFMTMGTLITSNDIQREYDVKQGQTVKTVVGNESFEISLQTVAQDSGVTGDVIRVRNTVNQKVLTARIMDKGMVRIE
jgi:flagella basal body P-ring formation protein FlgA